MKRAFLLGTAQGSAHCPQQLLRDQHEIISRERVTGRSRRSLIVQVFSPGRTNSFEDLCARAFVRRLE
jgi:hypothetical protein